MLEQPLWLDYSLSSTMNFIPVDRLVSAMTDLLETGERGRVYNLVHPTPPKVAWVYATSLALLCIRGFKRRETADTNGQQPSTILAQFQRRIDRRLAHFRNKNSLDLPSNFCLVSISIILESYSDRVLYFFAPLKDRGSHE